MPNWFYVTFATTKKSLKLLPTIYFKYLQRFVSDIFVLCGSSSCANTLLEWLKVAVWFEKYL